jgi:hypothetical protein
MAGGVRHASFNFADGGIGQTNGSFTMAAFVGGRLLKLTASGSQSLQSIFHVGLVASGRSAGNQ